ncbi:hypothetical protein [Buttiauxella sp. S04-F03]|uniref:hypothetical protein n=1 Tax=Buttiauxella sp. S04-F03 TaxID=2904525 RepID=UPI001E379AA8|nr:hypothetical protein [Buttiauxella sp. S04-F03]MCE0815028.1 hypothetical protein [Buttiauxella sp. S04-F03]
MKKLRLSLLDGSLKDEYQLIDINVKENEDIISIFRGKIDLSELLDWFKDNEYEIKSSDFPIARASGESLARAIRCFYENINTEDDSLVDSMFDYRSRHCLRFGARGTLIPEVYIGKSGNKYEISKSDSNDEWKYFIDIDDFFDHLKN